MLREVCDNLASKPPDVTRVWLALRAKAIVEDDELNFDWPLVFDVTKDKPVLCTALACADILLTLAAGISKRCSVRTSLACRSIMDLLI